MTKKIPERKCIACGGMFDKKALLRIVRGENGEIFADKSGKANGRGAYICRNADCFKAAKKGKKLEKAFKKQIPEEVYDSIERELTEN